MPDTLREYLGLKVPKDYRIKSESPAGIDPSLLYGIELEIENLEADEETRAKRAIAGMQYHKDGSLRNNGGEFVTLPMIYPVLVDVLTKFFKAGKYDDDNYSERCSVHVHANCGDLTIDQIRLILCLYQVLEKVLFNFVKADRDKNIFCVPLGESIIASKIMVSSEALIQNANRKWRKYTALNLLPLYTQGTIEFRHMAGTHDLEFILQWCEIIGSLFKYAREHKFEDVTKTLKDLNTSSAYATFMQEIFRGDLYEALAVGPYREYLEDGVINMKVMLAGSKEDKAVKSKDEEVDWLQAAAANIVRARAQPAAVPRREIDWARIDVENLRRHEAGQPRMTRIETEQWLQDHQQLEPHVEGQMLNNRVHWNPIIVDEVVMPNQLNQLPIRPARPAVRINPTRNPFVNNAPRG